MKLIIFIALCLVSQTFCHSIKPESFGPNELQGGVFILTDSETGLNLAIESTDDRAPLVLATPSDSNSQKFQILKAAPGNYLVANLKSGKYLSFSDDAIVSMPLTYTSDQQWIIKSNALSNFVFESHLQKKVYLAAPSAAGLNITTTHNNTPRGFTAKPTTLNIEDQFKIAKETLIATTFVSDRKVADNTYRIVMTGTNRAIEVSADGKNITMNEVNKTNEFQQFKVQADEHGHFLIVNTKSEQAITATGNQFDGGVDIVQEPTSEGHAAKQLWSIVAKGENIFAIRNEHNKEMITSPATNGEIVVQQYFSGATTQLFEFQPVA